MPNINYIFTYTKYFVKKWYDDNKEIFANLKSN